MRNSVNTLRVLIVVELLLILLLWYIELYFYSSFGEMITVNLLTGIIVSFVIAYIGYNQEKEDLMDYFFDKIYSYYYYLLIIKKHIKNGEKYNHKEVLDAINETINMINKNQLNKPELNFCFLFETKKSRELKRIFFELYESSFGVKIKMIPLKMELRQKEEGKKMPYEEKRKNYEKEVSEEIDLINKGIFLLEKKYKIKKQWSLMLYELNNQDYLK